MGRWWWSTSFSLSFVFICNLYCFSIIRVLVCLIPWMGLISSQCPFPTPTVLLVKSFGPWLLSTLFWPWVESSSPNMNNIINQGEQIEGPHHNEPICKLKLQRFDISPTVSSLLLTPDHDHISSWRRLVRSEVPLISEAHIDISYTWTWK